MLSILNCDTTRNWFNFLKLMTGHHPPSFFRAMNIRLKKPDELDVCSIACFSRSFCTSSAGICSSSLERRGWGGGEFMGVPVETQEGTPE